MFSNNNNNNNNNNNKKKKKNVDIDVEAVEGSIQSDYWIDVFPYFWMANIRHDTLWTLFNFPLF